MKPEAENFVVYFRMANKLLNDSKILENGDVLNSPKFPVTVISQHKAQNPSIVVNGTVKAQRKVGQSKCVSFGFVQLVIKRKEQSCKPWYPFLMANILQNTLSDLR